MIHGGSPVEAVDLILGVAALVSALVALCFPGRRVQVMGFLALSVMLPLIWLRLGSVDIAYAEGALGTGLLTGILVWLAVQPVGSGRANGEHQVEMPSRAAVRFRAGFGVLAAGVLTIVMASVWWRVDHSMPQWTDEIDEPMQALGIEHDVTAVLLGFRGYDTLLETAVLMLAGIIVLGLISQSPAPTAPRQPSHPVPALLSWFIRLIGPVLVLLALWFVFAGSSSPGGAFQSGAVLASVLVLYHAVGLRPFPWGRLWLRIGLVIGVIAFILAGVIGPLLGQPWLTWPSAVAYPLLIAVELMLTIGIATGLFVIYLGLAAPRPGQETDSNEFASQQEVTAQWP